MESPTFFNAGGTLAVDAVSYIHRRADSDIIDALARAEYVYVLDSRQKGKSSLLVRALSELKDRGIKSIRIDLQRYGSNLTVDQWYAGMLHSIGSELDLVTQLGLFWKENSSLGPAFRFFRALESIVLPSVNGPLVVCVDEIDYVQALGFDTDEFFACIRECFNRRVDIGLFGNLTFCLAGVASPSQLIQNENLTPFNIGRRIELTDFTRSEIAVYDRPLSKSGRNGTELVDRIFDWVHGHPYLTQLFANWVENDEEITSGRDIDRLIQSRLIANPERFREPNLADTERRLLEVQVLELNKDESRARVLDAYGKILVRSQPQGSIEQSIADVLQLSGAVTWNDGAFQVRNRLIRALFNETWRKSSLPHAEIRRQREASRKATLKAAFVFGSIFVLLSTLIAWLVSATHARDQAIVLMQKIDKESRRMAYRASMALAYERLIDGNDHEVLNLVEKQRDSADRGWEWDYLASKLNRGKTIRRATTAFSLTPPLTFKLVWKEEGSIVEIIGATLYIDEKPSFHFAERTGFFAEWLKETKGVLPLKKRLQIGDEWFSKQGLNVTTLSADGQSAVIAVPGQKGFTFVDRRSGKKHLLNVPFVVQWVDFSQKGGLLGVTDGIYNGRTYRVSDWSWLVPQGTYSHDDRTMFIHSPNAQILIENISDGTQKEVLHATGSPITRLSWFDDNKHVAGICSNGTVKVWDLANKELITNYIGPDSGIADIDISDNQKSILVAGKDGSLVEFDFDLNHVPGVVMTVSGEALSVKVAPDGVSAITISHGGEIRTFDLTSRRMTGTASMGELVEAPPYVFVPSMNAWCIADRHRQLLFFRATDGQLIRRVQTIDNLVAAISISRSGRIGVVFERAGWIAVMDPPYQALRSWQATSGRAYRIAVSPDGDTIALATYQGEVALIDAESRRQKARLLSIGARITSLEFSHSGRFLSAAAANATGYLFGIEHANIFKKLVGHRERLWQLRFSPDDTQLLSTSFDGTSKIWDVQSGKLSASLQHGSWVSAAEWSSDSKYVVTSSDDGFVRLFDPIDGFELAKLAGHRGSVLDVEFAQNGRTIVSSGSDHTVRTWSTIPNP